MKGQDKQELFRASRNCNIGKNERTEQIEEEERNRKIQEEIERQKRETDRQQREIERQNKLISENLDKIERLRQKRQHQNFTLRALSKENNSDKNTSLGL